MATDDRGCTDPDHPKEASFGGPQCSSCGMTGPDPRSADEEQCEHPNGFGVNGCACGATRPADDEAPTEGLSITGVLRDRGNLTPGEAAEGLAFAGRTMSEWVSRARESANEEARAAAAFVPPEGVEPLSAEEAVNTAQRFSDLMAKAEAEEEVIAALDQFTSWWRTLVSCEAPVIARKAQEYGSNSLAAMGRLYARGQGREVEPAEALELGCAVYMYGKVQRVADAMINGKSASRDTILDTMVYAAMMLFIRESKRWP